MSDSLSFIEIDDQHAELLPARTVLSMITKVGRGCHGGNGGEGEGGIGLNVLNIDVFGDQTNSAGNGIGGAGGNC